MVRMINALHPLPRDAEARARVDELVLADVADAVGVAGGEADDGEGVVEVGLCEGEERGGEEHGLVVGVGDEQGDALVARGRGARGEGVEPGEREREREEERVEEVHLHRGGGGDV